MDEREQEEPVEEIEPIAVLASRLQASMVVAGPGSSSSGARGRVPSRVEAEAWAEEANGRWDGRDWSARFDQVVEVMIEQAGRSSRHQAMLRATAIVVGDVEKGEMPGDAIFELARVCEVMYEDPGSVGLVAKTPKLWSAGPKEADGWSQIGGAIDRVSEGGAWRDRIAGDAMAKAEIEDMARYFADLATAMDEAETADVDETDLTRDAGSGGTGDGTGPIVSDGEKEGPETPSTATTDDSQVAGHEIPEEATERSVGAETKDAETDGKKAERRAERPAGLPDAIVDEQEFLESVARYLRDERELRQITLAVHAVARSHDEEIDEKKARELAEEQRTGRHQMAGAPRKNEAPRYLVQDWIGRGSVVMLTGNPSSGKSMAAVLISLGVATGQGWGDSPGVREPVLYLALEALEGIEDRIDVALATTGWDLEDGWLTIANLGGHTLDSAFGAARLERAVRYVRRQTGRWPGLVVADTFAQGFGGNENSSQDVSAYFRNWTRVMKIADPDDGRFEDCEPTLLVCHHPAKASAADTDDVGIRGSGAIHGLADFVIKVTADPEARKAGTDLRTLTLMKTKRGKAGLVKGGRIVSIGRRDSSGTLIRDEWGRVVDEGFLQMLGEEELAMEQIAGVAEELATAQVLMVRFREFVLERTRLDGKCPGQKRVRDDWRATGQTMTREMIDAWTEIKRWAEEQVRHERESGADRGMEESG